MPDRRAAGPDLYALVAEFDRPEALKAAVERARKHGFTRIEAFSPFPIDGLAEEPGLPRRPSWPRSCWAALSPAR